MSTTDDTDRIFTTLKVRPPKGAAIRKASFVSGTVVRADERSVTLSVTTHDDWRGTSSTSEVRIERYRILSSARPVPTNYPR